MPFVELSQIFVCNNAAKIRVAEKISKNKASKRVLQALHLTFHGYLRNGALRLAHRHLTLEFLDSALIERQIHFRPAARYQRTNARQRARSLSPSDAACCTLSSQRSLTSLGSSSPSFSRFSATYSPAQSFRISAYLLKNPNRIIRSWDLPPILLQGKPGHRDVVIPQLGEDL